MAAYAYQSPEMARNAKLYAADYTRKGRWLLIENSDVYRAESVPSPMGLSLFALPEQDPVPSEIADAEKMSWNETITYVTEQWNVKQ